MGMLNCIDSAACFWRRWVPTRPKSRLRLAKPSELQRSRSRFRWRNARKQPMRSTFARKRADQEDLDSDYLFADSSTALAHSPNIYNRGQPPQEYWRCACSVPKRLFRGYHPKMDLWFHLKWSPDEVQTNELTAATIANNYIERLAI